MDYYHTLSSGEKFIQFSYKMIPTHLKIMGVKTPWIKKTAKTIAKLDKDCIFTYPLNQYYEINYTFLLVLIYQKQAIEEKLATLWKYLDYLDNWAICDGCVLAFHLDNKDKDLAYHWIVKCLQTNKEFVVRFGLVMLLKFYVNHEYMDKIFNLLKNLNYSDYYVSMGCAWLLSVCYLNFADAVEKFLFIDKILPHNVTCMTIQKCLDSYRVPKDRKNSLKKLKKLYLNQEL